MNLVERPNMKNVHQAREACKKTHVVYLHVCLLSGKGYVGKTCCTVRRRWQGHVQRSGKQNLAVAHAIAKHGEDAWLHSVLQECDTNEQACEAERAWIAELGTMAPDGYNLTSGGEGAPGWKATDETRRKMSEKKRGVPKTEEHKRKISESNRGKKHGPEWAEKCAQAHRGKKLTPAQLEEKRATLHRIHEANRGKKYDRERVEKSAAKHRGRSINKGKVLSEETKAKISASRLAMFERRRLERLEGLGPECTEPRAPSQACPPIPE